MNKVLGALSVSWPPTGSPSGACLGGLWSLEQAAVKDKGAVSGIRPGRPCAHF